MNEHSNMVVLEKAAHAALGALGARLLLLSEQAGGELRVEARRARMLSRMPLMSASQIERALELAGGIASFVDNWSDCARPLARSDAMAKADQRERNLRVALTVVVDGELEAVDATAREPVARALRILLDGAVEKEAVERDALFDDFINPARVAAGEALLALCALADGWEREEFDGR